MKPGQQAQRQYEERVKQYCTQLKQTPGAHPERKEERVRRSSKLMKKKKKKKKLVQNVWRQLEKDDALQCELHWCEKMEPGIEQGWSELQDL